MQVFILTIMLCIFVTIGWSQEGKTSSPGVLLSNQKSSSLRFYGSAFYSFGSYSTMTLSKSANAFLTIEHQKKNFYTLGYHSLSFSRDDIGQNYFSEYLIIGKGTWWLGTRFNASLYYLYNYQGDIENYSFPFIFHVFGANGHYWLNQSFALGASYTGAILISQYYDFNGQGAAGTLQEHTDYAAHNYSLHISNAIGNGIWITTTATVTNAQWAGEYFFVKEHIIVPFGKYTNISVSGGMGRRVFYFDDELLLLYSQPDIQKAAFAIRGSIGLNKTFSLLPAFEYDTFDDYTVTYGSLGIRITL